MSKNNFFNREEIKLLLIECSRLGADRALERSGVISEFISRTEIIKLIGRSKYDKAVQDGELPVLKGGGKNGKILCSRSDFQQYLLKATRFI